MPRPERQPFSDRELSRPAVVLAQRFVQRWDLYAQQLDDGHYVCVREMLNVGHLFAHLRCEITLGTYLLDERSRARFVVLDADDDERFSDLISMTQSLAEEDVTGYLETSRRGGHLWLFLAQPEAGKDARDFGLGMLEAHGVEGVELFPKQERVTNGPGSLIRMPFGVHRLTGQRYGFITPDGEHLAPTIREQIYALRTPETVPQSAFDAYRSFVSSTPVEKPERPLEERRSTVSERIKASVTVMEFVSQYVDLKPTASGAVGLCPFHDDKHPSFGVNEAGNYWNCFAGCGGGSVIDWWMKWRGCDFITATGELAEMLL